MNELRIGGHQWWSQVHRLFLGSHTPKPLPWVTAPREEPRPLAAVLPLLVAESRRGGK